MPAYTLELVHRNGTTLGELPNAQLTDVTWANSGIGDLNFTMKQTDPRVADPVLRLHEVKLFIEGWPDPLTVPWQGLLLQDSEDDNNVSFSVSSLEAYLQRRHIDFSSLYYDDLVAGYEQTAIGWGLVMYAQGRPVQNYAITNADKDFRVTVGSLPTTLKRLRRYERDDHANILDMLNEFPTLVDFTTGAPNGFDWSIVPYVDGRRIWTPYYPQRGSLRKDLTLEYGKNISTFTVTSSMTNFAARAIATGASNGDIKIENEWKDTAAAALYGEDLGILSIGDQMDPVTLGAKARSYVQDRNHPIVDPNLQAVRVPVELLGVLQPGDTVPVSIHRGRTNIEGNYRVQSIKWMVRPDALQLTFYPTLAG